MDSRRVEKAQQCLKFHWCNPRDFNGRFISGAFQLLLFAQYHGLWRTHGKRLRKDTGFGTEVVFVDAVQHPVNLVLEEYNIRTLVLILLNLNLECVP